MHSQECAGVCRVVGEDSQVEGREMGPTVRKFSGCSQPSSHEPMLGPRKPLFLEREIASQGLKKVDSSGDFIHVTFKTLRLCHPLIEFQQSLFPARPRNVRLTRWRKAGQARDVEMGLSC